VSTEDDVRAALDEAHAVVRRVQTQLVQHSPPSEHLAEIVGPRSLLGIQRSGRLRRVGEVWRLGIFLMDADGNLFRAGETVRSENTPHIEHNSAYKAERREYAYAAFRAGFEMGAVVNFGASRIHLDIESLTTEEGSLFVRGRHVLVRWRSGVSENESVQFTDYLAERLELLRNPPKGATD
jgi:hypothetical protein